ncbi:V-set and immunoglobulin domain-containing protein 1-like [Genypterus blacodes]|uniref:V-set and immunoglobulin domain-containing protein 1-like n=1 Tax=Genypterus blacodes TaxID=154954 RepID=UPI003F76F4F0
MRATLCLMVLSSLMGCAELITVTTPQKSVTVTTGGTVLLQCNFVTDRETTNLIVQWNFESAMEPQQVYYYQSGKDVIGKPYEDRIHPPSAVSTTKNASITISNMQPSDAGMYTCDVHNFPDVEGKSEATVIVHVLEKPSAPFCSVHGDVESGHRVTLTCHSERGSPVPTYTWIRLDQTKTRRPVQGRVSNTGILEFRNISEFQFGEYLCNSSNAVGFSTCVTELSPEVEDGVVAGAVIGALLGCVLIALVVWFIAHTIKRHRYKAVKAPEASEMKGSTPHTQGAEDAAPMATTSGNLHADGDEPQA